jgi:Reverse transcriptase (RNA-dependent DNA polymerase)
MVPKKNGKIRFCVDYRKLNSFTKEEVYTFPLIEDIVNTLGGKTIFSKTDPISAYNQLRIARGHKHLTAFSTPFGDYQYKVMPLGLSNAPIIFQRFMTQVLFPLIGHDCSIYLDDIILSSVDHLSHKILLFETLNLLYSKYLIASSEKSEFFRTEIIFLGYRITKNGIFPFKKYVENLKDFKSPKSVKNLQSILGSLNFVQKFIPQYAERTRIFYD